MKVATSNGVLLAAVLLISITAGELINWKEYVNKIGAHVIRQLEAKQITGDGMPLRDFESSINKSLYGVRADGTVRFHSGFVAKINEATIKGTTYRSVNGDTESTLYAQMALAGMELFYDLQYQLSEYNATGNLVLWLPDTLFDLTIRKNLTSQRVTGTLAFLTTGNQNLMRVQTHPNNAYSQLTARELKQVASFRQSITAAIETWNTVWQEQLDRALAEYAFPEMCYYCPT